MNWTKPTDVLMSIESPFAVYICCCTRWRPPKAPPKFSVRTRRRHKSIGSLAFDTVCVVHMWAYTFADRLGLKLQSTVHSDTESSEWVSVWNYPSSQGRDGRLLWLLNCWPLRGHIFFLNSLLRFAWDEIHSSLGFNRVAISWRWI